MKTRIYLYERGTAAFEYVMLSVVLSVGIIGATGALQLSLGKTFSGISDALNGGGSTSTNEDGVCPQIVGC